MKQYTKPQFTINEMISKETVAAGDEVELSAPDSWLDEGDLLG